MSRNNEWKDYDPDIELDTNDEVVCKFKIRRRDGREEVGYYVLDHFLDINSQRDIDDDVEAYRELSDDELD